MLWWLSFLFCWEAHTSILRVKEAAILNTLTTVAQFDVPLSEGIISCLLFANAFRFVHS